MRLFTLAASAGLLLAMVAGCAAGDETRVSVGVVENVDVGLIATRLLVAITDDGNTLALAPSDIGRVDHPPTVFQTGTSGVLKVSFKFSDGTTIWSTGEITQPLRPDWHFGLTIRVDNHDPTIGCMGCWGAKSFPLDASRQRTPQDSIWVWWGGNGIRHQVVY